MGDSSIEWTNKTWNPVVGCSKVSPGCAHCYAEGVHKARLSGRHGYPEFKPWTPQNAAHNVTLMPHKLDDPLKWRKPAMVFVNSMSDLFHEQVPNEYIHRCLDTMELAEQHTFQILTKRPERMRDKVLAHWGGWEAPSNIWFGTSIENHRFMDRAVVLADTPAAVRFISAEPLLGPLYGLNLAGIHWLIVGGESGPGHRRFEWDWARDLRDHCQQTGTAFFVKQGGGFRPGDKLEDLPEDLRIRDYPTAGVSA